MVLGVATTGLVVLFLTTLGGAVSVALAAVAQRSGVPSARYFKWLLFATTGVCVATIAGYLAPTQSVAWGANVLYFLFSLSGAFAFFLFSVVYTGHGDWLSPRRLGLLALEPVAFAVLLVTNPVHRTVRSGIQVTEYGGLTVVTSDPGPLMVVHLVYVTGLVVTAQALLFLYFFRARGSYRKQSGAVIIGGLFIPIAQFVYQWDLVPIDPTALALVLSGPVVGIALFRYDFLEVTPLAASKLIEEMDDSVLVLGVDGSVQDLNGAARALFDTDPTGMRLAEVAPTLAAAAETGEPFTQDGPGGRATYDPQKTAITDPFGVQRGTLVVLRDISEQVRRQTELERQNERLEAFASVVSHDLRNPLAVAHGYAQLAIDEDDASFVVQTLDSLDRMDELIGDLLALAREGEAVDSLVAVSLDDMARQAWRQVETDDATLVVETDATVQADDRRLRQLFENLFRNAVDHAGEAVTVTVGAMDDDAGFFVADDGPGVPAEARERVFEHGYTTNDRGTGFGLAIVRTIAEAHGWQVAVTESESGGARFEVSGVHLARSRAAVA